MVQGEVGWAVVGVIGLFSSMLLYFSKYQRLKISYYWEYHYFTVIYSVEWHRNLIIRSDLTCSPFQKILPETVLKCNSYLCFLSSMENKSFARHKYNLACSNLLVFAATVAQYLIASLESRRVFHYHSCIIDITLLLIEMSLVFWYLWLPPSCETNKRPEPSKPRWWTGEEKNCFYRKHCDKVFFLYVDEENEGGQI